MKPLTPRMESVLCALDHADKSQTYRGRMTANEIARHLGFHRGQDEGKHSHNGRAMAPAQRVIFSLNGLHDRKLVGRRERRDGLSGGAFCLTAEGRAWMAAWKARR